MKIIPIVLPLTAPTANLGFELTSAVTKNIASGAKEKRKWIIENRNNNHQSLPSLPLSLILSFFFSLLFLAYIQL